MAHKVHIFAELLRQIRNDLRIQHPEWIQPNGESPMCDSYEARLMELLAASIGSGPARPPLFRTEPLNTDEPKFDAYI
jgi:hypothetical protein